MRLQDDVMDNEDTDAENALGSVLLRLTTVLREENARLESASETDHSSFITAKNQVLRELMGMQRAKKFSSMSPAITQNLLEARELVDRNSQLLKLQVNALNDVTSFLTQSSISDQGDGTYTREHQ